MRGTIVCGAAVLGLLAFTGSATALDVVHNVGFTKTCAISTNIGDSYQCSYLVQNSIDEAHDTLTVNGLVDVVHSAGGDQTSGNVFGLIQIDNCTTPTGACTQSSASCTALSGTGTRANPWTSVTSCTLPVGSMLNFHSFSHYTVQAADFGLPGHSLTDTASLTWHDLCDDPLGTGDTNCVANPPDATAQSSTTVQQLGSATSTQIHNPSHQVVTSASAGDVVHDFVSVTGQSGKPNPTGNVTVEWFSNGGCTGAAATSTTVVLDSSGQADATGLTSTVTSSGAFRATYLGDGTYAGSTGACETLFVPTAVRVASLQASRKPAGVLLRWRMASEVGVLGYNVYRERKGVRIRLTRAIMLARGGLAGRSYSYLDRSAPRARRGVRYWLRVVETDGSRVWKAVRAP